MKPEEIQQVLDGIAEGKHPPIAPNRGGFTVKKAQLNTAEAMPLLSLQLEYQNQQLDRLNENVERLIELQSE